MRGFNSTIKIKQKVCVSCGKSCVWFSKKRCQQCAKIEDTLAKDEKEVMAEDGLGELIEKLDKLVSRNVRLGAASERGICKCYTCGAEEHFSMMDAGHYISRKCMFLRFDVSRNIRPQCKVCNQIKHGMAAKFAQNLESELPGITDILLEESRAVYKWSRHELQAMINDYAAKNRLLEKSKIKNQ